MQINFGIEVILYGALVVLGVFASFILFKRSENIGANKFLSLFLLLVSLWLVDSFLRISGIYNQAPDYYFLPIYYSFAFGPLVYLYVKRLIDPQFHFKSLDAFHFIPVSIQAALYFFLSTKDYSYKRWYWIEVHQPYTYRIEFDGTFISLAIYVLLSIQLLSSYKRRIKDHYSDIHKIRLHWLRSILIVLFVLCIAWFVEVIFRDFYQNYYQFNYTSLILGLLTLILAYGGITQPNLSVLDMEPDTSEEDQGILEVDQNLKRVILQKMKVEKAFLNPALSLKEFANLCGIPKRKVSQTINLGFSMSFHDFVNHHRVEAVKSLLKTADLEVYTIQGIAMECGFNSKATFNRIFKSYTGITPTQFVKKEA